MPHLTGLAALAATDSSSDKATVTTTGTFTEGLSMWSDPFAAAKELPNVGTLLSSSTEKGLGYLLVPVAAVLLIMGIAKGRG